VGGDRLPGGDLAGPPAVRTAQAPPGAEPAGRGGAPPDDPGESDEGAGTRRLPRPGRRHDAGKVEGVPPRSEEETHRLVGRMVENGLFVGTGEQEQTVRYLTAT
jgi:hypothetical protein